MTDNREFSPNSSLTEEIADVVRERFCGENMKSGKRLRRIK